MLGLALSACGGDNAGTDDKGACEALRDGEGDEAVYGELRGMNLSNELRTALDNLEATSTGEEISPEVFEHATKVAALCEEQGVTLQG